jgi:hypothetical protein
LGSKTSANSAYSAGSEVEIALTVEVVDVERAESRAAVMSVTSMTEYKMILSRLGLIRLVGRITGSFFLGVGEDEGGRIGIEVRVEVNGVEIRVEVGVEVDKVGVEMRVKGREDLMTGQRQGGDRGDGEDGGD